MFFNNLKRKISTGHIGKQDTFDPPSPFGTCPKIHSFWWAYPSLYSRGRWCSYVAGQFHFIRPVTSLAVLQFFRFGEGSGLNAGNVLCSQTRDLQQQVLLLRNNVCGGRRAASIESGQCLADTCCCWYKVTVTLCFSTMSSSLQLCHKLRLDAVHKLEKYTCMIYVDCQAS